MTDLPRTRRLASLPGRLGGSAIWAPVVVFVVVVSIWQGGGFHALFGFPAFAVPYPDAILAELTDNLGLVWAAAAETVPAAVAGYASGMAVGFLAATVLVRYLPSATNAILPSLTATNSLPIVAMAPLVAFWVGGGLPLKVIVVTIMIAPTMAVYAVRGMTGVDRAALELYASYEATPFQVYRHLQVPSAMPYVFTAMKSAVVLALIGTIVSEVVRSWDGLGFMITQAMGGFRAAEGWLALIAIAVIGITWYLVIEALERLVAPWDEAIRQRE